MGMVILIQDARDFMKKPILPNVSSKNTKEQILEAYTQALDQLQQKEMPLADVQKITEKEQLTERVSKVTNEGIVSELGTLKSEIIRQLDTLSSQLLVEFKQLTDIQAVIAFEQQHLEYVYGIKESAQSLAALLQSHAQNQLKLEEELKTKKAEIEEYVTHQKQLWKESQEAFEKEQKEAKENLERQRIREEEEYVYNRDLNRRKDHDTYMQERELEDQQIKAKVQELETREKQVVAQEQHISELEKAVAEYPQQVQEAINTAEEKLRNELTKNSEMEKTLLQKDYESQLQLKTQHLESYLHKIKEQEALIKELTTRADLATKQVQDIACKALESSAQRFVYQSSEAA